MTVCERRPSPVARTLVLMTAVLDAFRYEENTDKQVLVLKFTNLDGDGIGMLR